MIQTTFNSKNPLFNILQKPILYLAVVDTTVNLLCLHEMQLMVVNLHVNYNFNKA